MTTQIIKTDTIYPSPDSSIKVTRQYVDEPWPFMTVGETVQCLDAHGWLWDVRITSMSESYFRAEVLVPRKASPLPPVGEDGKIMLSNVSGHAHLRDWRTGDIVVAHGGYYRVTGIPRVCGGSHIQYRLKPVTQKQWESRPGYVPVDSESHAHELLGSAVQTKTGEWLHLTQVKFRRFYGSLGAGYSFSCHGKHVTAKRAAAINATHPSTLSKDLHTKGVRSPLAMPSDAVVLIPKKSNSLAASGERVAVVGRTVFHERNGDPDNTGSWYSYVVEIRGDKDLLTRVKKFIKSHTK